MNDFTGEVYGLYCICERCQRHEKVRYVGVTSEGAEHRYSKHIIESRTGSQKAKDRWIRKHGAENIRFSVLETGINTPEELKEAEIGWIAKLDTFNSPEGLNMTRGGDGVWGLKFSEETRARFRERTAEQFSVKHPRAILREADVVQILDRVWQGETSPAIAREYGVSSATIQKIRDGVNWGHVPRPKGEPKVGKPPGGGGRFPIESAQNLLDEYREKKQPLRRLSEKYGVSEVTVSAIINKRRKYQVLE